jgi:cellulose synthase/poly-beta-1,6-N-acetylglucosamine synthase-like glycosyltransferase
MSVVVCTNRTLPSLQRVLDALHAQTIRAQIEIVVVDDGSPSCLDNACHTVGAKLVRHEVNRGTATARNSGLAATTAPVIAYTDDDCIPDHAWAEHLLAAFDDASIFAAGGDVRPPEYRGYVQKYYAIRNPLAPLEEDLAVSPRIWYRLWLYLKANTTPTEHSGPRSVYSLPCANCAFRRSAIEAIGGFDTSIRFAGEDGDAFFRLRARFPNHKALFVPEASVVHVFSNSLWDTLRRAHAYGRGHAYLWLKHPQWGPTIFPIPVMFLGALALSLRRPRLLLAAFALPPLMAPRWLLRTIRNRSPLDLTYAYVQCAQEAASNLGFFHSWLQCRPLVKPQAARHGTSRRNTNPRTVSMEVTTS